MLLACSLFVIGFFFLLHRLVLLQMVVSVTISIPSFIVMSGFSTGIMPASEFYYTDKICPVFIAEHVSVNQNAC